MAAGGEGGYPYHLILARGRGRECHYPQTPAGGGGYPKPQIPAGGGYPNPQIPAGGGGGGYPNPQIPGGGGYPNPQIPAGGGGYHNPQIPAGGGGYHNPQIPAGGGGGYPNPQIQAGGGGGYPNPQIQAGGRGRKCHYTQIPGDGGGGGGYFYPQTHVGQMMVEKYKDLASKLVLWLNSVTNWIVQSGFPAAFMEMKAMLVTIDRFRALEVPPMADTKKEIFGIYNNLQNYGVSPFTIEEGISPSKINLLWTQMESALLDQQAALQREINRLEGLQHLLERIEKEVHILEGRLDYLERVLEGDGRQCNDAKSTEGKQKSMLDGELKDIENHVASLVNHVLTVGLSDVHPIYDRVLCIRRRAGHMRTVIDNNATQKPPPGPSANKVVMSAQYQQSSHGAQMVETSSALQHVKFCFQWILDKHTLLEGAEYGNSMDSAKQALDLHQKEHEEIISFKTEVDKCVTDRINLALEEQKPYEDWLSHVQIMYPVLHEISCKRQEWLVSLQVFLQEATDELIWMDEKSQLVYEYSRRLDEFNIPDEQMYKTLVQEITSRESQIKSVQDRGYAMIINQHPATETVEVHISRTESKWSWLQQLLNCLDKHIRDICAYHQFFQEVQSCEQWINQQTESVNNYMELEKIPFKKLEQMKIECQDLQNALVEYEEKVAFLDKTSHDIIPLKQRNHQVTSPVKVYSLCVSEHPKVINSHGQQVTVPSICLVIPPPNFEAIAHANRLNTLLEQLKTIVKSYDRKLTENIVMSTIKFIKTWDLGLFQSLDPTTCMVLVRDLNDGAEKLIAEAGNADQNMQLQLEKDLDECNSKVQMFSKKLSEEVCEERQPDKTNSTAVDRDQSPQTSYENKSNVTKIDGAHPVITDESLHPASIPDFVSKFGSEMVNRETRYSAKIASKMASDESSDDGQSNTYVNNFEDPTVESIIERMDGWHLEEHQMQISGQGDGAVSPTTNGAVSLTSVGAVSPTTDGAVDPTTDGVGETGHYQSEIVVEGHHSGVMGQNLDNAGSAGYHLCNTVITGHNPGGTGGVEYSPDGAEHFQIGTAGAGHCQGGTGNNPGDVVGSGYHLGTAVIPGSIEHKPGGTGDVGYNPSSTVNERASIQKLVIEESSACDFLASQYGNLFLRETEDIHKCRINVIDQRKKSLHWENRPTFYDGWCQTNSNKRVTIVLGHLCDLESRMIVIPSDRCLCPAQGFENCFRDDKDIIIGECLKHLGINENTGCRKKNLGDCFYNYNTGSFPCSIICHAVFVDNGISKRKVCTKKNLSEVLRHIVETAKEAHMNSVAIPVCQYGGPTIDDQISAIKETIKHFLTSPCCKNTKLGEIFLCVMDKKDADLVQKKMEKLFRKVDEKPLTRLMFNVSRKFKGLKMQGKNHIKIELKFGLLHEVNADVLVNTTGPDLDLKNGSVSKAILAAAGPDIQQECRKEKSSLNLGEFVITGPGKLNNCKKIFHGALPMWDPTPGKCEQILKGFMEQCLLRASREGMKSIAFPSLGTGNLKFPWHRVAKAMYESVEDFEREKKNTSLETVLFVIYQEDKMSKEAFFIEEKRKSAKKKLKMQQLPIQQCRNDEETLEGVLKSNSRTVKMKVCQGDINQEPFDCTLIWMEKCDHDDGNCPILDAQYYSPAYAAPGSSMLHNEFKIHSKDEADHLYRHLFIVFKSAMQRRHTVLSIQLNRSFTKLSAGAQAEQIIRSLNELENLECLLEVHIFINSTEDLTSVQSYVGAIMFNKPGFWSSVVGLHQQFDCIKLGKSSKQTHHYPQPPFEVCVQGFDDESCEAAITRIRKHICASDMDSSDENDEMKDYTITSVFEIVEAEVNPGFLESGSEVRSWQPLMDTMRARTKVKMTVEGERLYIAGTMNQILLSERVLQLPCEHEQLKFNDGHFQDGISLLKIPANCNEYLAVLYSLDRYSDLEALQITYEENFIKFTCNRKNIKKLEEMISSLLSEIRRSAWEEILLKPEENMCDLPHDDMVMVFYVKEERKVILFSKSTEHLNIVKHKVMVQLGRTVVTSHRKRDHSSLHTSVRTDLTLALSKDISTSNQNKSTKPSVGTFHTDNGIMIRVYSMQITDTDVECIVNATDVHLRNSHGVSKAIANAAGRDFKQACENHILLNGQLQKNQPVILPSGSLKYRNIISIAGPQKCKRDEIYTALSQLECIIFESLKTVNGIGLKSVALPSVSAGLAGMPSDLCAQQYCRAVDKFIKQADGPLKLQEIHFVDINQEMTQVIQTTFAKHFSSQKTNFPRRSVSGSQLYTSIVPQLKEEEMVHTEYSSMPTSKASYSDETNAANVSTGTGSKGGDGIIYYLNEKNAIKVIIGDICDIKADALVSIEDENGSGNASVAKAIFKVAGSRYIELEHSKVKMTKRKITDIVVTGAGQLNCQFVLHAIAPEWNLEAKRDSQTFQKNVTRTMLNIMDAAFEQKLKSFAVPLIGTSTDDKHEEPLTTCCEAMIDGLHQWIKSHSQEYWFDTVMLICSNEAASQCIGDVLHAKLGKEGIEKGRLTRKTLSKPSDFQSKSDANTTKLSDSGSKEDCVICMESITDPKVLPKCGHTFCKKCIDQQFKYKPVCPCCGVVYGKITGIQPEGTMKIFYEKDCLPGFETCGTIVIFYEFNGGTQKKEHPRPGRPYGGTKRKAYLPDNDRGRFVLRLLREAFERRLVFTIGTSRTTGQDDTVTWNDIHHKTNRAGGPQKFGFPDATYLDRVTEELAVKGVTKESLE